MKILRAKILNPYRSHTPRGYYNIIKGHSGVDIDAKFVPLESPVTGKVVLLTNQNEMGQCMYIEDSLGNYHVFAHLKEFKKKVHDLVQRKEIIAITGNTGRRSTGAHLHYEIVKPHADTLAEKIMSRPQLPVKGYNTDPIKYLKDLYFKFHVNLDGDVIASI